MQKLIQGIHKFQNEVYTTQVELFRRLEKGQNPEVLFITCSDSRINPNLITQTEPGDLFIIRNAGNIVPAFGDHNSGEIATIEFAIDGLGIKDIIVCGHSHCGAMKGLLKPSMLEALPSMRKWLKNAEMTRRIIFDHYKHLEGDELLMATTQENVLTQIEHLKTHPSVASKLSKHQIRIHAWVYKFETGEIFQYDSVTEQFIPLTKSHIYHTKEVVMTSSEMS